MIVENRVRQIRDSLADAFGGYSQYSLELLGQAIAGQINNNALGFNGIVIDLCMEAARQECQRWDEHDPDLGETAQKIEESCRAALERLMPDYEAAQVRYMKRRDMEGCGR